MSCINGERNVDHRLCRSYLPRYAADQNMEVTEYVDISKTTEQNKHRHLSIPPRKDTMSNKSVKFWENTKSSVSINDRDKFSKQPNMSSEMQELFEEFDKIHLIKNGQRLPRKDKLNKENMRYRRSFTPLSENGKFNKTLSSPPLQRQKSLEKTHGSNELPNIWGHTAELPKNKLANNVKCLEKNIVPFKDNRVVIANNHEAKEVEDVQSQQNHKEAGNLSQVDNNQPIRYKYIQQNSRASSRTISHISGPGPNLVGKPGEKIVRTGGVLLNVPLLPQKSTLVRSAPILNFVGTSKITLARHTQLTKNMDKIKSWEINRRTSRTLRYTRSLP